MTLAQRSHEKEMLDEAQIDTQELFLNLRELDMINRVLGGYRVSCRGLSLIQRSAKVKNVLDIGFGGGDSIRRLSAASAGSIFFYGVDLKEDCVSYAHNNLVMLKNKKLICSDYRELSSSLLGNTDVIHCSLFLHHLDNEEIVDLFKIAHGHGCILLINDLHRHWFAYYSIKMLTALFSRSRLVKNDAPLSVKRGFTKTELTALLDKAGYKNYSVTWNWAFRYLVIAYP